MATRGRSLEPNSVLPSRAVCSVKGVVAGLVALSSMTACTESNPSVPSTAPAAPASAEEMRESPPSGPPDGSRVSQNDPTAVSKAAVTVMWSYDARIDARTGQRAAYLRASGYFTPAYRAYIVASMPASPLPAELVEHRARSRTILTPAPHDDAGPDTVQSAARTWRVTVVPLGRDGWRGRPVTVYVYVALTRPGPLRPWRIRHVTSY